MSLSPTTPLISRVSAYSHFLRKFHALQLPIPPTLIKGLLDGLLMLFTYVMSSRHDVVQESSNPVLLHLNIEEV